VTDKPPATDLARVFAKAAAIIILGGGLLLAALVIIYLAIQIIERF
jgi:hypothetical protein